MSTEKSLWRANKEGEPVRRHILADILPMEEPISIDIEVSSACCLRCKYCPQSLENNIKKEINIGSNGLMTMDIFYKVAEQIGEFSHALKNIRFAGFGEPLLNKNIVDMVDTLRKSEVCETITIFSNGIPLTKDISDGLAGKVDTFLFDIQGLSSDDYVNWCGTEVDYRKLIDNIRYLHRINGDNKIFCKTFKSIVSGREEQFYDVFEDVCDEIGIEDLYEIYPEIDYSDMVINEKESEKYNITASKYCSYPWYQMAIDASGRVTACTLPVSKNSDFLFLGNVNDEHLLKMWNGKKLNAVRYKLLTEREKILECKDCKYTNLTPVEDRIDNIVPRLANYCKIFERK